MIRRSEANANTVLADPKRQCQYFGIRPVFHANGDRSEYFDERGVFIENLEVRCRAIADIGQRFCPRHILLDKERKPVSRYECNDCKEQFSSHSLLCRLCAGELYEIPVEVPL